MHELCQIHSFHMCTCGLSFCLLFVCFIGVSWIYSVVLVSAIQVNQLYIYICPLFYRFFSCIVHYRILSEVPCAIIVGPY